ncbi:hypothetical protein F7725_021003 [Dissostichus mawsoni]|uniref:Uncharacterized protein n=1 Tax=Dissostichus mawsoni TaxID=36200 RepID=A0A7J5YEW3_DISMA|nr:hypothetical protein F7725_021003 [Dissostichus mawsoni]
MTQRTSRASSTVASALQITAASAMSRGLVTTGGRGTRFTIPPPEGRGGERHEKHNKSRVATLSGTPATFRERARRPIINQDPGVASSIHACGAEGTRGLLKRMTDHRVHVCVHRD